MATSATKGQGAGVAIYLRVSSDEQVKEGFSLANQEALCRRRCEELCPGTSEDAEVFRDEGFSGALGIRQFGAGNGKCRYGLSDLVEGILRGRITTVVSWRFDRITRDSAFWHRLLNEVLGPQNVDLVLLDQQLDTKSPVGRLNAAMMAAVAGFQRELTGRNIRDNHDQAREEGYFVGQTPFGWEWPPPHEQPPGQRALIRRSEDQGIWVERMAEWYLAGWRTASIARELNDRGVRCDRNGRGWTQGQVLRCLRNPLHAGFIRVEGELREGVHAPLRFYLPETYYALLQHMEKRRTRVGGTEGLPDLLLNGLLTCGQCGRRFYVCRTGGRPYYLCHRTLGGSGPQCSGMVVRVDLVDKRVLAALVDFHRDGGIQPEIAREAADLLSEEVGSADRELEALRRELADLERQMERWDAELSAGTMTRERWRKYNDKLQTAADGARARIREIEQLAMTRDFRARQLAELKETLSNFDAAWQSLTEDERRELVHTVVDRLVLHRGERNLTLTMSLLGGPEISVPVPLASHQLGEGAVGVDALTLRQKALLWHLHSGLTREETAERMGVELDSVKTYICEIRKHFDTRDLPEIIAMSLPRIEEDLACLPLEGRAQKAFKRGAPKLKPKDWELLEQLSQGITYTAIAAARDPQVNVSTVQRHAERLFGLIGAENRDEAGEWYASNRPDAAA